MKPMEINAHFYQQMLDLIRQLPNKEIEKLFAALKKEFSSKKKSSQAPKLQRKFGSGRGIFTFVSDDFNEPLSDFNAYAK